MIVLTRSERRAEKPVSKPSASQSKRFYPALDGLRAIAVLLVFCQHYLYHPSVLRWGWAGVDIFFVLSGFLITGILYDTRNAEHRFRNFYVRRILRIFPLYYGVLLAALLLNPIFHWIWLPAWSLWALYLGNYTPLIVSTTFIHSGIRIEDLHSLAFATLPDLEFRHFWSLCIEEQFYLVWPFVVFALKDRVRLRNVCLAAVVLAPLLRLLCVFILPAAVLDNEFLYHFTPLRADALLLGGLLALCLRGPEAASLARLARPVLLALVGAFAIIQAGSLLVTHAFATPDAGSDWVSTLGYSGIDLAAACIILLAIDSGTTAYRILNRRPLRRLGQISYGFYVFHNIPHDLYTRAGQLIAGHHILAGQLIAMLIAFPTTLGISYLSFRFFETPFLRLKDRFTA